MRSIENKDKKKKIIKVLGLVGLFVLVFGLSYALFRVTLTGKKKTRIKTANFGLTLTDINGNEESEGIAVNLENAVPESDEEGLSRDGYKFVVTNTGSIPASYELKLNSTGTLSEEHIKYALIEKDYLKKSDGNYYMGGIYDNAYRYNKWDEKDKDLEGPLKLSNLSNHNLDKTTLLPGEKMEYELKLWVEEDATVEEASGKYYETNIIVDGHQAEEYMSGKTGDTSKYTLYKDGTLAITGTGKIKTAVPNESGFTVYNNAGPFGDIAVNYLNTIGYDIKNVNNEAVNMEDETTYHNMINVYLGIIYSNTNFLEYLTTAGDGNDFIESFVAFGIEDANAVRKLFSDLFNMPVHVTKVVMDEGIASIEDGAIVTGANADYMVTLPTTLENIDTQAIGISTFEDYVGYGLIMPEILKTIPAESHIGNYLQYLNLSKIEKIETHGIYLHYMKELNLPNTLKEVESEGISVESDAIINIDNTREYVESHWDSNWLNDIGHNVTINYLR